MSKQKQFGKREMFHTIQRQMIALDSKENMEEKYLALKQVMVNLETLLQVEEQIHGIALDYEVDRNILDESRRISGKWLGEVGEYKAK